MKSPASASANTANRLRRTITPLQAWALSIGTSIGWGSFVITSNTYLSGAGPFGSALGMIIGALVMLIIAENYYSLMCRYPDAGGVYSYVKNIFGHGDGFLVAWFLSLTYLAILWANATSLPLFARYFLGDIFRFGKLYTLFGYDVFLGEALLVVVAVLGFAYLMMKQGSLAMQLNAVLALVFTLGISFCFAAAILKGGARGWLQPRFIPDIGILRQVAHIAFISPWAFIGFENITHAAEEFSFPVKRSFRVLTVSVIVTTLLYIFVTLLSVTAFPPEYESWLAYIRDLDHISGIKALPAFYAAQHYLGSAGVWLLMLSLLALIVTSLIGNSYATSRLFCALARDGLLPAGAEKLSPRGLPENALFLVAAVSLVIPFLGRTCIGWIVDVTTVGATIVYGFVSAAALKHGLAEKSRRSTVCGGLGLGIMLLFAVFLLLPNLFFGTSMETESYFIFILWSMIGLFYFHRINLNDEAHRFDNAIHVWVALLSIIVFMAVVWMGKIYEHGTLSTLLTVHNYYAGKQLTEANYTNDAFLLREVLGFHRLILRVGFSVLGLFALSLSAMLWNYVQLKRSAQKAKQELGTARSLAYTDPLTGVKSKHAFVEHEMEYDRRIDAEDVHAFGIIVGDLNGTKTINDTLGHRAGDEFIRSGCQLICRSFKSSPVFRIGGDEFAIILEGSDYERREELLEDLNRRMESNIGAGSAVASLGMAVFRPGQDHSFRSVFERADLNMYARKKRLKELGADVRD